MKKRNPLQVMFLGTGSDVGKSVIAAGFCRILSRRGYRVVPFKAQNMALNSFVTMDGKEMGRAQVLQAEAAGLIPDADMNPILLKPSGDNTVQVVVQGKVFARCSAGEYYRMKMEMHEKALQSYRRLWENYDAVVLEGAGSAAELNLREGDIVNMSMAALAHAPVILVGDIDRGGIFAQLIGTTHLFSSAEKKLLAGFIINKFRGDRTLFDGRRAVPNGSGAPFESGTHIIEKHTKRPVFGIVPFFDDIHLPEEDSVALQHGRKGSSRQAGSVVISVIALPHISNYTDFDPFEIEEQVTLRYVRDPREIAGSSAVIIPGTKNTIDDLSWLRKRGFPAPLRAHVSSGKPLVGICGGYQMLGTAVEDPHGVESSRMVIEGLGYLMVRTRLEREKTLSRVRGESRLRMMSYDMKGIPVEGYEIHMGRSVPEGRRKETEIRKSSVHNTPAFRIYEKNGRGARHDEGAVSTKGLVWGTYLHGVFENDDFRAAFLSALRRKRRSRAAIPKTKILYRPFMESQFDRLADLIEKNVDVARVLRVAEEFR